MVTDDDEDLAPPIPPLEPVMPTLRDRLIAAGVLTPCAEEPSAAPERVWPRERGHRGGVKHRREAYR